MTDKPETKKPAAAAKTAPKVDESAIAPAVAVHSIVVGNGERVLPGSFYTAKSAAERKELLDLGAIREFEDEAELALFEKIEASKKDIDPAEALG